MKENKQNNCLYREVKDFLGGLNYVKIGNKTIAIGKTIPYIFEVSSSIIPRRKYYLDENLIKDFLLLKKIGYIRKVKDWQRKQIAVGHLGLHVAHTCNMRCRYCFAGDGTYGSKIQMMSPETTRKAVIFYFKHNSSKRVDVIFVGGEPLLNLPAIKTAIKETKNFPDYDIRFKISTNGTLLNKKVAQFLAKNKVGIVLSYDGPEHDKNRPFKNGGGSAKKVLNNIYLLKRLGIKLRTVKACIAKESPYSFIHIIKKLSELPVPPRSVRVGYEFQYPPKILRKDMYIQELKYLEQLKSWIKKGEKLQDLPLNGEESRLDAFVQARKRPFQLCGFAQDRYSVVPNGDMYFCTQRIKSREFNVGNIEKGFYKNRLKHFMKYYALYKPLEKCKRCFLLSLCEQHCVNIRRRNKILSQRCNFARMRFEKLFKIFLELTPEDTASIYFQSRPELKDKLKKTLSAGYRLRSFLWKKTSVLKPINILPLPSEPA